MTRHAARRSGPPMLRRGDQVVWRGGWGTEPPRDARVTRIERDCNALAENGEEVESLPWAEVRTRTVVVDLDNGSWAYGYQLEPKP